MTPAVCILTAALIYVFAVSPAAAVLIARSVAIAERRRPRPEVER